MRPSCFQVVNWGVRMPSTRTVTNISVLVSAIVLFIVTRPSRPYDADAVKITPASSVGAKLAAIDDATINDVPAYETKLAMVSKTFKEDPAQIMAEIQTSAKALKKDGNSATMFEYLNGLSMTSPYHPWQTIPSYCKLYEDARQDKVTNDQAWLSAGIESSAQKK